MPNDVAIEARIPVELDEALARVASATGKSKSSLLCEALSVFVSNEEQFIIAVEEGRAAARSGRLMDHDEVVRDIGGPILPKQ